MPSIERPQPIVTVNASPRDPNFSLSGTVQLTVLPSDGEDGLIALTPEEARMLADHLRTAAKEAEIELPAPGRRIRVRE